MRVIEHPFSDLLRSPKQVTGEVEKGDVVLRRRDEADLRLTLAERDKERSAALAALGRTLRNLAVHEPESMREALADAFPWMEFLPKKDRALFAAEFADVLAGAVELDTYAPLSQLLREWRDTAEVHADPKLATRLRRPLKAAGGSVSRPGRRVRAKTA
ncbi:MAG: DUF6247 family protein [Actinomycetota bacterium]